MRYGCRVPRILSLLLLLLLAPAPASAAEPTDLNGTWRFDEASRQARTDAIEARAADFPRLLRGVARKRLTAAVQIRERYVMATDGSTITISSDHNPVGWATDLVGTPVPVTTSKGEAVTLSRRFAQGALHSRAESERGFTTFVFAVAGDRMEVRIEVHNEQLEQPLAYTLVYAREPG